MGSQLKPRAFKLHFNRLGMKRGSPDVWTIQLSRGCLHARHVSVRVPVETIYKGDTAPQPRAYLKGKGILHRKAGGVVVIKSGKGQKEPSK